MNWVLEQLVKGQWVVLARFPDQQRAELAKSYRACKVRFRVREKPIA